MLNFGKNMYTGLFVLTLCVCSQTVYGLTCRECNDVESLDECINTVDCSSGEVCYMEEKVTQTNVVYKGGCRATDVCHSVIHHNLGKRDNGADGLISCSRCCDSQRDNVTGLECNSRLCGLNSQAMRKENRCYECTGVHDFHECNTLTVCQEDEMCGSTINLEKGDHTYTFGCYPRRSCIALTSRIILAGWTHATGKRSILGCQVCCGDAYCNTGPCPDLLGKLDHLFQGGNLDLATLKQIRH